MGEKTQELKRICAWCKKLMGTVMIEPMDLDEDTTHGMCEECFDRETPKPCVDEALVMFAQSIAGRNIHDVNGILTGYIGTVEAYHISDTLADRMEYRRMWQDQYTKLKKLVSAEKRRRAEKALARR